MKRVTIIAVAAMTFATAAHAYGGGDAPVATTLLTLTLSGNSFSVGDPQGTIVGNVMNTTAGSTVAFDSLSVANSLQLVNVAGAWQVQVGSSAPGSAGTLTFNLVETLAGTTNSPNTTRGFTVNEGSTPLPPVAGEAISVSLNQVNSQSNGSFILGGTVPTLAFQVTGTNPNYATYISYTVSDETGNVVAGPIHVPITTNASGLATPAPINAPAAKLGYYRVDAKISSGTALYPTGRTVGTRPPGFITYAVMHDPDARFTYASNLTHFGVEDLMSGGPTNSTVPSSTLAFLGIRWVGDIQQQWAVVESRGPNTFSGTLPVSYWNTTASVTPTNASWKTYNIFYFTAAHIPAWAIQSGTCGFIETDMCALNATAISELPHFASAYATAAKNQYPNQDRYYQITWETWGPADFGGTDAQLLKFYQLAYPAIHAADPSAIVMGPTMFVTTQSLLKLLQAAGSPPFSSVVDGISMHDYESGGWPPENNNGYWNHTYPSSPDDIRYPNLSFVNVIHNHQNIMTGYKGHSVPLIGTEAGYDSEAVVSPIDRTNRSQVDLGLLQQAQGNVRQSLIWLGEGGASNTLFKIADFWLTGNPATDPGSTWGAYFNLDQGSPSGGLYGARSLGPKPSAPSFSAMTWILDGYNNSNGPVAGLTGTQMGYSFTRTVHAANTIWALWDYSTSSTASVSIPAGAYQLCDWMGNCTSQTSSGTVSVAMTGNPIYIIQ